MCYEITHPLPNCNSVTVEVLEWISNSITLYWTCDYLSILGFFNEVLVALIRVDVIKWKKLSALLVLCEGNSPITGEFPSQRPVTRSFGAFFDLRLNKRLGKQLRRWWFQAPLCSFWRHCNVEATLMLPMQTYQCFQSRSSAVNVICDQWRPTAKDVID